MKLLHVPKQIPLVVEARVVSRTQLTVEGFSRLSLLGILCRCGLTQAVAGWPRSDYKTLKGSQAELG